ncbi:MAG: hypothetical protein R3Y63_12665 [Eubacteriales bacterium]
MNKKKIASVLALGLSTQFCLMAGAMVANTDAVSSVEEAYITTQGNTGKALSTYYYNNNNNDTTVTESSSDSESSSSTSTVVKAELEVGEDGSVVFTPVTTVEGTSSVATITEEQVADLIAALKDAEATSLTIVVSAGIRATGVELAMSSEVLAAIMESSAKEVVMASDFGTISLDSSALSSIMDQGDGGKVAVGLASIGRTSMSTELLEAAKYSPVVDMSISVGETRLEKLNSAIKLDVPYSMKNSRWDTAGVNAKLMSATGEKVAVTSAFDKDSGKMSINSSALGMFVIEYDAPEVED